jgi:hypothetical protein
MAGQLREALASLRSRVPGADPALWLVVAFSLLAAAPLAGPDYFFDAHDAPNTVFFLTEFDAALRDGVWYPGWATDQALGYGYPTFVLYPPLAYYVAEGFHLLGATKVAAIKWTFALATVGAGLAMYAYARRLLGRWPGFLAAVVYVYVPYHLVDLYVRAALAEYCAFVWMPLALLAFHRLVEGFSLRRLGAAGLAYGALWLTHNHTGLTFTPLLAAYILWRLLVQPAPWGDRFARAGGALGASLLGLSIAAALLVPNLLERAYINQEQWVRAGYDYALHFVPLAQLLSTSWGYLPGPPGTEGGMSVQLGVVPLVLAAVAAMGIGRRPPSERGMFLFFLAATLLVVLLMMPIAAPLWDALPIAALIQFPWRLLAVTAVTLSILAAFAVYWEDAGRQSPAGHGPVLVLALVAVLGSYPYLRPQYTATPPSAEGPLLSIEFELEYEDMRGMTAWTEEMPATSPLVEQYLAGEPLVTAEALAPGAEIEMIRAAGASDELWVRSPAGTAVRFYTYYFPGWRVFVDGERLPDSALRAETIHGLLTVDVPAGERHVVLRWGDTPQRLAAKVVTVSCILLALAMVGVGKRRKL